MNDSLYDDDVINESITIQSYIQQKNNNNNQFMYCIKPYNFFALYTQKKTNRIKTKVKKYHKNHNTQNNDQTKNVEGGGATNPNKPNQTPPRQLKLK